MHADRTNRIILTLFGLLLVLAGLFGLIASLGGFGTAFAHRTLLANEVSAYIGANGTWVWPAAAAVSLLVVGLSLRWMVALLLSTDRADDITITRSSRHGTTIMHPAALTGAVTREIETYHDADKAKARVTGDPGSLTLVVTVAAFRSADLPALRHRIESEALSHARNATGKPDLPIQLDIDVSGRTAERIPQAR